MAGHLGASHREAHVGEEPAVPALAEEERAVSGYSAPTSATTSAFAILSARRDAEERLALVLADRIAQRIAVEAAVWSEGGGASLLP